MHLMVAGMEARGAADFANGVLACTVLEGLSGR